MSPSQIIVISAEKNPKQLAEQGKFNAKYSSPVFLCDLQGPTLLDRRKELLSGVSSSCGFSTVKKIKTFFVFMKLMLSMANY